MTSLQAQATEHRMVKEKLQAAVAAALGDATRDIYAPQHSPHESQQQQQHHSGTNRNSDSVTDLQNAITELKVYCARKSISRLPVMQSLTFCTALYSALRSECGMDGTGSMCWQHAGQHTLQPSSVTTTLQPMPALHAAIVELCMLSLPTMSAGAVRQR